MTAKASFDFTGKVVFITGGGTGIGEGMGEAFATAGATVAVGGRRVEPLQQFCARHPDRSSLVQIDVSVDDDRRRAIDTIIERHGRLDVLINNALGVSIKPFEKLSLKQIQRMYDVTLVAPTVLTQLALPHLIKTKGSVINTSSVGGRYVSYPSIGLSVYSAAKAGVNHLTRNLAAELGPQGVRVNAISPGPTRSAEATEASKTQYEAAAAVTPLGRVGEPTDVAGLALYLASDAGAWITGQVIDASGGWGLSG